MIFTKLKRPSITPHSHYSQFYRNRTTNRYLNLFNDKLTPEKFDEIVECLLKQKEMQITVHTVDFRLTTVISENGESKLVSKLMLPTEVYTLNPDINFLFTEIEQ